MSWNSDNPFAPPSAFSGSEVAVEAGGDELARRFTRFASALVDGLLMIAILIPIYVVTGYFERARLQQVGILEQLAMSLAGMLVMLVLNGYLLFNRGQTIGKMLTGIQIVDFETGRLLPFLRVYVFRYLWMLPLVVVVLAIPGNVDDLLLNLVILFDVLMIFGGSRRCLHDLIAGSKVVLYTANRPHLADGLSAGTTSMQ